MSGTTNTYARDCPTCGPGTYRVEEGVAIGCLCDFEPETLTLRCEGSPYWAAVPALEDDVA